MEITRLRWIGRGEQKKLLWNDKKNNKKGIIVVIKEGKRKDTCWGAMQEDPSTKMVKSLGVMQEDKHKDGQELRNNARG